MPDSTADSAAPLPPPRPDRSFFLTDPSANVPDLLGESEARFRALAQATGQIYWIADAEGNLTDTSSWATFTGQTPEQAAGSGWLEAVHPEDRKPALMDWTAAIASVRPYRRQHRVRRADGQYRMMIAQAYPAMIADGTAREWVGVDTDITLLQELQADALSSQEDFSITFEIAAVGMAQVSPQDGRILRANQKLCDMLGYPEEELQGHTFQDLTYPEDLHTNMELFERLVSEQISAYNLEKRYIRKDGSLIWANLTASLERDLNGRPGLGIAVVEDITEKRRLSEELRAQVLELEAVFAAMSDGLVVIGTDGAILHANPAYESLLGWPAGTSFYTMPPGERLQALQIRDDQGQPISRDQLATFRLLQGEMITQDQTVRRRDGQDIYVSLRGAPLTWPDGRIAGAVIIVHDNSERRRLEEQTQDALGAMLRMAEMLVQNPSKTADRPTLLVGRRLAELACSLLGCPMATILSLDPATSAMQVIGTVGFSADQEKYLDEIISSWRTHAPVDLADLERLRSGETFLLDIGQPPYQEPAEMLEMRQAILAPMLLEGQVIGLVIFNPGKLAHAFTRQQIALAGATAQLLGLVVERERLLSEREEARASALALQDSNRQMDTFLGMVGHELRIPLASAKLSIQVIRRRLDRTEEAASPEMESLSPAYLVSLRKLVTDAERKVLRLERLLEDLLEASRIKEGKLSLRLERADLADLLESTVAEQRQLWPVRDVQLQIPATQQSEVQIDQDLVRQAVSNYLTNALKYSPETAPVLVGMDLGQRQVRVWVRDFGPGIALADQEHIWERFHRVPGIREQSETSGGLGLGLYVTKMVIEQHHGEVGIISALGRGSTFWFTLPRAEATKSRNSPGN